MSLLFFILNSLKTNDLFLGGADRLRAADIDLKKISEMTHISEFDSTICNNLIENKKPDSTEYTREE
jgi:hypothetical protein